MKTLLEVQDELSNIRNFVECAFMACEILPREHSEPIAAVLDEASDRLKAAYAALDEIRGQGAANAD